MIEHVLRAGRSFAPSDIVVVCDARGALVAPTLGNSGPRFVVQQRPRGTGDAAAIGLAEIPDTALAVILFADHPLLTPEVVTELVAGATASRARVTVLTCLVLDAAGYGRIDRDELGRPRRIVEKKDDDPARRVGSTEVNSGMMVVDAGWARSALARIRPSEATGEIYLTDLVALAVADGIAANDAWPVATVVADPETAIGVNTREDLAIADGIIRQRIRRRLLEAGVSLIGAETIFVDADVRIGPDTTLLPFTYVQGTVEIGSNCVIGPHSVIIDSRIDDGVVVRASVIEGATIASDSDVGPFSHLRANTHVGSKVHIGNFAELKNANVADGVAIGHVSYLGDASIGAGANIGAGTITANWDGTTKHPTEIQEGAFIGVDTMLIAPVRVGVGGRTGAGAVVTRDVPDGATAVGVPARVTTRPIPDNDKSVPGKEDA